MIQIKAGKYYRTRDGRKVGPMVLAGKAGEIIWGVPSRPSWLDSWKSNGAWRSGASCRSDLIAEWVDEPAAPSPVRTVTRKEIVPGTYGRVRIFASKFPDRQHVALSLALSNDRFPAGNGEVLDIAELRAAAKVFTDIADALVQETK